MKVRLEKIIDLSDWDETVVKTYGRPYSFQQQDGCKSRGLFRFSVPSEDETLDYERTTIPEIVNGEEMGVSFAAWLARNPKTPILNQRYDWERDLWWTRNFYPDFQMVANDLHARGLLEAGDYAIDIDW
jgi:hypothetical protein